MIEVLVFQEDYPLKGYNSFGVNVYARWFVTVRSIAALQEIIKLNDETILILGKGSNILLTQDVDKLVVKNEIYGKEVIEKDEKSVLVAVGAGEVWHHFVWWCIENAYGGIENLSMIPGTVGAAPIQNIGAYGVELKDTFERLEAVDLATGALRTFTKEDCQFGYRNSIFKQALKGKYCITKVYLRLSLNPHHQLNLSYGAIRNILEEDGVTGVDITIGAIAHVVSKIRSSKLPDPAVLGNSGSFFKNPEIPKAEFEKLQKAFPNIVFYPLPNDMVKIPAGWLIEQCGWKGKRVGKTGTYEKQALVIVNYGDATGSEILDLALDIMVSVKKKFGISLTPEVNIL